MKKVTQTWNWKTAMVVVSATLLAAGAPALAQQLRVLGVDISAWQGNISQTTWNNIHNVENRQFILLRSSRGGTTGYYDQNDASNANGLNTFSQRYDDPYYIQNINRVVTAGMFAGTYHFSRPDIIETTLNSGGIRNSGTDEADHFIQMAGPWMRPGYLVPIHDLEAGDGIRTDNDMAQFCIDFANRIYVVMGIRPGIYINGNYAANVLQTASVSLRDQLAKPAPNLPTNIVPSVVAPCYPYLWVARWPNQTDPNSIDVQNTEPKDTYAGFYGPWDDYGVAQPWKFWQYASTMHLPSYSTTANLDVDVAHGGIEFLKDQLIPAVWMNDSSGDWSTLINWNSGQTPTTPVTGPGQVTPVATGPLPTPRLPGAAGSGTVSGQNDTVILERPNANITVTLASGTHNIRKLYMRETLTITGGSLSINYVPSWDSTTNGAQFSGSVTLSGSASLSVHTLQVDAARTFTLNGGSLTFNTLNLMPGATPAKLAIGGDVNLNPLTNATAAITNGAGSGSSGSIDLAGGTRAITVTNGVNLFVSVPIANGGLAKTGLGTMRLGVANTYSGGTTISAGTLEGAVASSIPGNVTNSAGTLKLDSVSTLASGAILALAGSPGAGAVSLGFSGTQTINSLYFGTTRKAAGTWAASGASHNNAAFAGAGLLNVTAGPASTTAVSLTSGSSPSIYGDSLTFTATVTGNSPPGGTVQFKVDGVAVGGLVTLVSGSASLVVSNLSVSGSPHLITAYYSGDDNNNLSDSSTSPLAQIITARSTSCLLTSSGNPSVPGTNVTFTAAVNGVPPAADLPTGNVVFSANGTPFATNALISGSISASTTSLPPGTNAMTAQYVGDGSFLASTGSVDQLVKSLVTCSQTNALLSIADHLDGTFTLTFLGTPQADYFVLASLDATAPMTNWAPVVDSTNTVTNLSGVWRFTVTNTTPQQFYRSTAVAPCP